jgi:omega-6 fatty acid desaturase (delta-12 desaturase)
MQLEAYSAVRKDLLAEGAFRVNNLYGGLTALAELALFGAGTAYLLAGPFHWAAYPLLELVLATSAYRLFVLLHECGHHTLFRQKVVNTAVGTLVSPCCLVPYVPWRNIHALHHQWVGVVDKDPTQAHLLDLKSLSPLQRWLFRAFWKSWVPVPFIRFLFDSFWGYPVREYLRGELANAGKGLLSVLATAVPHALLVAVVGPGRYLFVFGPMLLLYYVIFEMINLPQHSGHFPYLSESHPRPIPFREQDAITRSTRLPRLLAVLLCYNFNLHTEHHLFPTVPWYSLPRVSDKIRALPDCRYEEAELPGFMVALRKEDPIDVYVKSLPSPEADHV